MKVAVMKKAAGQAAFESQWRKAGGTYIATRRACMNLALQ